MTVMQNKRNRHGREGHNVIGEPQDSIHLGLNERIRLEDVPLENESGNLQVGNRAYNDARYLLKNQNSNWRLISSQILVDSPTAGRINASWYSSTGVLKTLTNSPLTFAGATSPGNFRWDLVELYDNGTAAVKTGTEAVNATRPTPTANTVLAGELIWDEDGSSNPVDNTGSFSNDLFSTQVAPNTTGLYAKIWEGDLSVSNNYGIFIAYHEPTNPVNFDGTGVGLVQVSWTCDTDKNIESNTVRFITYPGSKDGEFRLVQITGNKAAIYHKSNHYWGRIQFRIVFQNSSVRIQDFVNLGPYGSAPSSISSWDSKVFQLDLTPVETTGSVVKFDKPGGYIHGNSAAITGNITYNFTGEILGTTVFMLHRSSAAPTFPSETRIIKGSYVVNTDNYIWFCITKTVTGRIVQVTISQT